MINLLRVKCFAVTFVILFFTGCASTNNQEYSDQDPLESMNRAVFEFNETLDDNFLEPAARGYRWLVPDPIELLIGNVFSNLNDVVVTANSLLQFNFESALASGTRVLINSTFGMLGIVDIASDISAASDVNLNKRDEDFG
ncbi:MAG: VacJ family lipoprotein, partial [Betaproteobacteria bacterium]|nr:VacJ family lipoprotein [Betaproteobacteria bacterium]